MFHDKTLGFYEVGGCDTASKYIKDQSSCTQCPFGDCVYSLKPKEKDLILQSDVVRLVYLQYDILQDVQKIVETLNMEYSKVQRWIKNRKSIESKLDIYAAV